MLATCLAFSVAMANAWAQPLEEGDPEDETPEKPLVTQECRAPFQLKRKNRAFQNNLVRRLNALGLDKAIKREQLAVSVVDLSRRNRPAYAGVNDDKMMYSASLPKIAILMTVINHVANGSLTWTHEFDKRLLNMIVASDNPDASWGVDQVGLPAIEEMMRDPRYCFYDDKVGGLWVGRSYGGGGGSNRDPLFNISHGATSRQAARVYAMLEAGQIIDAHWSFRMMGLMSPPRHTHKFVAGLQGRAGVVFLARKSGTWRNYHSDSALIQHQGRIYAAVAISEHKNGEQWMREIIQVIDDLVMDGAHLRGRPRKTAQR
jgi:beta-lactamase class A